MDWRHDAINERDQLSLPRGVRFRKDMGQMRPRGVRRNTERLGRFADALAACEVLQQARFRR